MKSANQYIQRTLPGFVNVLGEATNTATVSVLTDAGVFPATRHGDYWRAEVAVSNAVPLWLALTNLAVLNQGTNADLIATNLGHLLVPPTPETFTYDADGNLTSDSLWTNTWNAENRRTGIESRPGVPAAARVRAQWTHLPDGRWIERIVSTNTGSGYVAVQTNRYVWDGHVLLAVLNHTNGLELSFLRGLDLSGTPQRAGGVGGLLAVTHHGSLVTTHFVAYDGNGNVAALVSAADGTETARYEYGPFGEPLRVTGPMGRVNPLRFSTQYADDWTGDLKYLHRDYRPDLGRWPNRDPIGERGGLNLYAFVVNDPINEYDIDGRILGRRDRSSCVFWDNKIRDPNKCTSAYATAAAIVCRLAGESLWEQCQRACLQDTYTPFGENCCDAASTARFIAKTAARYAACAAACAIVYGPPTRPPLPPTL